MSTMKRFTRHSKVKRKFSQHVFDTEHRATVMVGRIDALRTALDGHFGQQPSQPSQQPLADGGGSIADYSWGDEVDEPSVTSCVINVCSSRNWEKENEQDGGAVDESLEPLPQFYRHPLPEGLRFPYMVPRNREEWRDFVVWLVKQRITFKYLTNQKLKRIIDIARGQIGRISQAVVDPDIPDCYNWDEEQVGNWLEEIGFPQLQNVFRDNFINGRRLLGVDASALNRMGIRDFKLIQELALNIRSIFGLTRPNGMRPMLRNPPFETFLTKHRIHNGSTYDLLTFKKFCKKYHYDYEDLIETKNMNAQIPCACTILIRTLNVADDDSEGSGDSAADSLNDAHSVEFQVRHQFIRNQAIEKIINELIELIFRTEETEARSSAINLDDLINKILNGTLLDLGFGDPQLYTSERLKFAAQIALALLAEVRNTADVMSDINRLKTHLKMKVSQGEVTDMKIATGAFIEELAPIAALLALNQLSLEAIFRHEPEFENYVMGVVTEAEKLTNEAVPIAAALVDSVLTEALTKIKGQEEFGYSSYESSGEAPKEVTSEVPEELVTKGDHIPLTPHFDDGGKHLVYPAQVDPVEGGMKRIFKSKGRGNKPGQKKKSVTSRVQTVHAAGDTLTTSNEHISKFWMQSLSPRLRTTGSLDGVDGQGPHVPPSPSSHRPRTAPVDIGAGKKGYKVRSNNEFSHGTKARDIWNEVKLLQTVAKGHL